MKRSRCVTLIIFLERNNVEIFSAPVTQFSLNTTLQSSFCLDLHMYLDVGLSLPRTLKSLKVFISHALNMSHSIDLNPYQRCASMSARQHPMHMKKFYFLVLTWVFTPPFSLWHWISVQNFPFSSSKMAATVTNLPRKWRENVVITSLSQSSRNFELIIKLGRVSINWYHHHGWNAKLR